MIVQYFILGEHFQLYLNCVSCLLLFNAHGYHRPLCSAHLQLNINTTLRNDEFFKGSIQDGKPKYVITEAGLEAVT